MSLASQPLVSVVTPVYNGEKYLAECIESVLAQSYENWEYVIVNNCSTDRTLEISVDYARKDKRIRIHNNTTFLPVIQNVRNALHQISGESKYCKPVLADDWLFPECLTEMVKVAEPNSSVGLVGAYRLDDRWVNLDGLPYPSTVLSGRSICRAALLGEPCVFGSPTSLLYRSHIIRTLRLFHNESHTYADVEACFDILQNCDFGFVHQVLTYTRRHKETVSASVVGFNPYPLIDLLLLKQYGAIYLTREEFDRRMNESLDNHYRFLAKSVFELREKEFWNYHRNGLQQLGCSLSLAKLARAYCLEAIRPAKILLRSVRRRIAYGTKKGSAGAL